MNRYVAIKDGCCYGPFESREAALQVSDMAMELLLPALLPERATTQEQSSTFGKPAGYKNTHTSEYK